MKKGIFVLSLDMELAWGCREDKTRCQRSLAYFLDTGQNVNELLELLEKYSLSATWAVVGHLFLPEYKATNGTKYPEIAGLDHDWPTLDPGSNTETDPVWYGRDIVESIRNCKIPQEIACHTFSHVIATSRRCTQERLDAELKLCQALAGNLGIELKSFVFPNNQENYHDLLPANDFIAFRGKEPRWYSRLPELLEKVAFFTDSMAPFVAPPVQYPRKRGCWDISGSYFYGHCDGLARLIPIPWRVAKIKKGIYKAAKEAKVFHLWFHPFNLATNPGALLEGLDSIFKHVAQLRNEGLIENLTMGELARNLEKAEN
jgi:peptidoglycan/xylan/chitin deacetylase (PgdA/CDA1 family)